MRLIEPYTDLLWNPTAEIMYPPGYQTWVEVEAMTRPLEGAMRPGHFRGVTTVVAKLFTSERLILIEDTPDALRPVMRAMLSFLDAPEHAALRRKLLPALLPEQIAGLKEHLTASAAVPAAEDEEPYANRGG